MASQKGQSVTASQAAMALRQAAFLRAFVQSGVVSYAVRAAQISRSIVYHWRRTDARFERLFLEAAEDAADLIEFEARRRAVEGWDEEVYQGGVLVGTVRRYSGSLLAMLLRCRKPEVYGSRARVAVHEHSEREHVVDSATPSIEELRDRGTAALQKLEAMMAFGGRAVTKADTGP